jgi:hypothetical protein
MVEGRTLLPDMVLVQQHKHSMEAVMAAQQSRLHFTPFFIENILQQDSRSRGSGCRRDRNRSGDSGRQTEDGEVDVEYRRSSPFASAEPVLAGREEPLDLCKNQARRRGDELGVEGAREGSIETLFGMIEKKNKYKERLVLEKFETKDKSLEG